MANEFKPMPCPPGFEKAAELLTQLHLASLDYGPRPGQPVDVELDQRLRGAVHQVSCVVCERARRDGVRAEQLERAYTAIDTQRLRDQAETEGAAAVLRAEGLVDEDE